MYILGIFILTGDEALGSLDFYRTNKPGIYTFYVQLLLTITQNHEHLRINKHN